MAWLRGIGTAGITAGSEEYVRKCWEFGFVGWCFDCGFGVPFNSGWRLLEASYGHAWETRLFHKGCAARKQPEASENQPHLDRGIAIRSVSKETAAF